MLVLLAVIGISYVGASYVADRFPVFNPGFELPGWFPGTAPGEVYVVTNAGELNMREQPGLTQPVITTLPEGTQVRKLEGPVMMDNVPWMRVRANVNNQTIEGWVSTNFLVPLQ